MPKKNSEVKKAEIVQIRLSTEVRERCTNARLDGLRSDDAESSFLGYLVKLGLAKYEKAILPVERGDDESVAVPISEKKKAEKPAASKESKIA